VSYDSILFNACLSYVIITAEKNLSGESKYLVATLVMVCQVFSHNLESWRDNCWLQKGYSVIIAPVFL